MVAIGILGICAVGVGFILMFAQPEVGLPIFLFGLLCLIFMCVFMFVGPPIGDALAGYWGWATHVGITPWPNLNGVLISLIALVILGAIIFAIVSVWPAIVAIGGTVLTILLVIGGIVLIIWLCILLATWLFHRAGAASLIPMQVAYLGAMLRAL